MILVDTSAWIEYARGTGSGVHLRLRGLIATGGPIATTEPVVMELISGLRRGEEARIQRLLTRAVTLAFVPVVDFEQAGRLYRACRSVGVTPSGLIDCMVAVVARRYRASILAQDIDFARIASVVPLQLDPATPTEG